jgi:hypothetical protein
MHERADEPRLQMYENLANSFLRLIVFSAFYEREYSDTPHHKRWLPVQFV